MCSDCRTFPAGGLAPRFRRDVDRERRGHAPGLLALGATKNLIRTMRTEGVIGSNRERLASFELGGRSHLGIADTRDSFGLNSERFLVLVPTMVDAGSRWTR